VEGSQLPVTVDSIQDGRKKNTQRKCERGGRKQASTEQNVTTTKGHREFTICRSGWGPGEENRPWGETCTKVGGILRRTDDHATTGRN